jgi:hypothetical protein
MGLAQYALVKLTAVFANLARLGVFACGCPPSGSIQSFKSSIEMKRILGLPGGLFLLRQAGNIKARTPSIMVFRNFIRGIKLIYILFGWSNID